MRHRIMRRGNWLLAKSTEGPSKDDRNRYSSFFVSQSNEVARVRRASYTGLQYHGWGDVERLLAVRSSGASKGHLSTDVKRASNRAA